jgi:hypothetical protein
MDPVVHCRARASSGMAFVLGRSDAGMPGLETGPRRDSEGSYAPLSAYARYAPILRNLRYRSSTSSSGSSASSSCSVSLMAASTMRAAASGSW